MNHSLLSGNHFFPLAFQVFLPSLAVAIIIVLLIIMITFLIEDILTYKKYRKGYVQLITNGSQTEA